MKKKKKKLIIGGIIFFVILIIFFTLYFVIPAFSNDRYGNRLNGLSEHKISSSLIDDIKDEISSKDGVNKVIYHREGKILNFSIITDGSIDIETAKGFANIIKEKISAKNQKYYDIEVLLESKKDTTGFPNIGYKHRGTAEFSWGNVGESSE